MTLKTQSNNCGLLFTFTLSWTLLLSKGSTAFMSNTASSFALKDTIIAPLSRSRCSFSLSLSLSLSSPFRNSSPLSFPCNTYPCSPFTNRAIFLHSLSLHESRNNHNDNNNNNNHNYKHNYNHNHNYKHNKHNKHHPDLETCHKPITKLNRRTFMNTICNISTNTFCLAFLSSQTTIQPALAKTGQIKTSQFAGRSSSSKPLGNPKEAFQGLLNAREELQLANQKYIIKNDMDGLRSYLMEDVTFINSFEGYALTLLASKTISDEDKKAIGTIRTYGVGADVMIMYGGLLAEIDEMNDEPDPKVASKFLNRSLDSLNEVIQICINNGF